MPIVVALMLVIGINHWGTMNEGTHLPDLIDFDYEMRLDKCYELKYDIRNECLKANDYQNIWEVNNETMERIRNSVY